MAVQRLKEPARGGRNTPRRLFTDKSEAHARDNERILKRGAMAVAVRASCPLHLGVLDSPDYWTDEALASAVRPLSARELHQLAVGSERERLHQQGHDLRF